MGNWLRRVMTGRYGVDQFTWFLLGVAVLLSLLSGVFRQGAFQILSWAVLIYGYFRIFSRNVYARQKENQALLRLWYRIKNWFIRSRGKAADRRDFRFFACPSCKQKLRVPKGKGKISITCPKCGREFIKKT